MEDNINYFIKVVLQNGGGDFGLHTIVFATSNIYYMDDMTGNKIATDLESTGWLTTYKDPEIAAGFRLVRLLGSSCAERRNETGLGILYGEMEVDSEDMTFLALVADYKDQEEGHDTMSYVWVDENTAAMMEITPGWQLDTMDENHRFALRSENTTFYLNSYTTNWNGSIVSPSNESN